VLGSDRWLVLLLLVDREEAAGPVARGRLRLSLRRVGRLLLLLLRLRLGRGGEEAATRGRAGLVLLLSWIILVVGRLLEVLMDGLRGELTRGLALRVRLRLRLRLRLRGEVRLGLHRLGVEVGVGLEVGHVVLRMVRSTVSRLR